MPETPEDVVELDRAELDVVAREWWSRTRMDRISARSGLLCHVHLNGRWY